MSISNGGAAVESSLSSKSRNNFCTLSLEASKSLEQISYPVTYPEHAELIAADQPPQAVFVLYSGRAKLSTASRDGKQVMLRVAEAGEVLGLSSVISGTGYDITAKTLSTSVVRVLRREDFLAFLQNFTETSAFVLDALAREYQNALHCLRSLAWFPTATARVAQLLLQIAAEAESAERGAKLALTQEQIAQMTATTRETVTRLLAQLRRERIIALRGSNLVIRDRRALERLAS